jgi:hypothetical protein
MNRSPYRGPCELLPVLDRVGKELYPLVSSAQRHSIETIWLTGSTLRNCIAGLPAGRDIDFVFFNDRETSKDYEKEIESRLTLETGLPAVSVKNQARLAHEVDGSEYPDIFRSINSFPDITVALAARVFNFDRKVLLFYIPYGLACFRDEVVSPTPSYLSRHSTAEYQSWIERKFYERRMPHWKIETRAHHTASTTAYSLISCP